jgi:hypothetical protein
MTEWHNADELVRDILDCGGKRSATPLSDRQKSDVTLHLPPQSQTVHWQPLLSTAKDQGLLTSAARVARRLS